MNIFSSIQTIIYYFLYSPRQPGDIQSITPPSPTTKLIQSLVDVPVPAAASFRALPAGLCVCKNNVRRQCSRNRKRTNGSGSVYSPCIVNALIVIPVQPCLGSCFPNCRNGSLWKAWLLGVHKRTFVVSLQCMSFECH